MNNIQYPIERGKANSCEWIFLNEIFGLDRFTTDNKKILLQ